jgi:cell division protein FtsW (lipid II flippase)
MFQKLNWKSFDWWLLGIVLLLCGLGAAMIFSAIGTTAGFEDYWLRQIGFTVVGLIAIFIVAAIDYRQLSILAVPAFILFVLSLVAVFAFGTTLGGSKSWLDVAGTTFQPTETGKFLIIIFLAWYLSWFQDRMHRFPYLVAILLLVGAPARFRHDDHLRLSCRRLDSRCRNSLPPYRHTGRSCFGRLAAVGGVVAGVYVSAHLHLPADRRADRTD